MDALGREELVRFYELHGVTPNNPCPNYVQYCKLMTDAHRINYQFGCFVRESFVGTELRMAFESWEELLSCYSSFMAGFIGSR